MLWIAGPWNGWNGVGVGVIGVGGGGEQRRCHFAIPNKMKFMGFKCAFYLSLGDAEEVGYWIG